jgi:hypothetical protein
MPRAASRNDSALHRSTHRQANILPVVAQGRLAWHLGRCAWRPLRALDALLEEIDRVGPPINRLLVLQAKAAREVAWAYMTDETGEVWR